MFLIRNGQINSNVQFFFNEKLENWLQFFWYSSLFYCNHAHTIISAIIVGLWDKPYFQFIIKKGIWNKIFYRKFFTHLLILYILKIQYLIYFKTYYINWCTCTQRENTLTQYRNYLIGIQLINLQNLVKYNLWVFKSTYWTEISYETLNIPENLPLYA